MQALRFLSVLTLGALLLGCAVASSEAKDPNKYVFSELEEVSSIREFDIDSWTEVDKKSLIVNTSPSKSYLIILKQTNHDLRFAHAISFGKEGRIYSKFDRIHIINSSSGVAPLPATIERIYKLDNRAQKKMIITKIREADNAQTNDKKETNRRAPDA